MARAIGRAFKVSRKDVKGYGYVSPKPRKRSMAKNPGVTAIAAINGRGAYRGRKTARQAMTGLSRNERIGRARTVTQGPRARGEKMATKAQIAAARRNIRKAIAAKRAGGTQRRNARRRIHRRNSWYGESARHSTAAKKGVRRARRAGTRPPAKRRTTRRRRTMRSNAATAKQRAAARRNIKKAQAALRRKRSGRSMKRNGTTRRRRASTKRRSPATRRRRRSTARRTLRSNVSRKRSLAAKRGWAKRRRKSSAKRSTMRSNRRRSPARRRRRASTKRRTLRSNVSRKRSLAAKRGWAKRRRKTGAKRRTMRSNRRRSPVRRRRATTSRRRSMRRNATQRRYGAKAFRRNQTMATLAGAFRAGLSITAGFAAQKALSGVVCKLLCDRLFGAAPTPTAPPTPAPVSGLEVLQPYSKVIASGVAAVAGIAGANMVLKDTETKKLVTGGMASAFLHQVLVTVLERVSPVAAQAISGVGSDSEAAKLSAMYGLGAQSIAPRWTPIGQDESNPWTAAAGMGMGEYFAESMSGLGAYTANPDLYQAAAGFGAVDNANTNHIDPSSNLDRELSIAEAAAGIGEYFESGVAGLGEYFESGVSGLGQVAYQAAAGMGAIDRVPGANTWLPGMADSQLWAGTRGIRQGQMANATTRAGILQSGGNQGVFG